MVESKTCRVLPLENLRAIQCMRRLSLPRSIIDTYKYQDRILKTFYYNINHIVETEIDALDQLIVDQLAKQGRAVFHIFHSRGIIDFAPNEKDWFIKRAYVFINRLSRFPKEYNGIDHGILDAFIICEPINGETQKILEDGVFSTIRLSKFKNFSGETKNIWSFDD